ncbi:cell envelope integrity protein TolA [Flavobacterium sp. ST-87]|uniref:Cell envelope integrity protein TolA n=1 Tax=Flavobacterium plantiphilum TaxID=3163297 RepID=A0ABW8XVG8_9FLAO
MKIKFLLSALLMLFFLNSVNAQSHKVGQANYNCKLNKKGWFFNSEKLSCPACEATDKKEKTAKAAEDKRRNDVAIAKANADKLAAEKLRQEKLRLAKEEEKRIKDKEIADKIANDKAIQKNKQIAASAAIKSNVKGQIGKTDPSTVTSFYDNKRRVYGLIADGKEIITFPYEENLTTIRRINDTNLFEVHVSGKHPNGWEKYLYSFIIDYKGKRLSVNGLSKFDFPPEIDSESNKIYLYKKLAESERVGRHCPEAQTFGVVFQSKEAAVADVSKGTGRTCQALPMVSANVTVYSVDYNFKLIEQVNGYVLFGFYYSGFKD